MTELLKDMMNERADSLGAPDLDVLGMVREGHRRVNRRRTAVLGAGVAAAVVAAVAVPSLMLNDRDTGREWSYAAAFAAHEPSYAKGSTVTIDSHDFDAGHDVASMVQTTAGIVFVDASGTVFASSGGGSTKVGQTSLRRDSFALEAGGSVAAWIEYPAGRPVFTAFDQATGQLRAAEYVVRGGASEYSQALWAVDGHDVWFRDDRGAVRWNITSDEQAELGVHDGLHVYDVKAGVVAYELANGSYFGDADFDGIPSPLPAVLGVSPGGSSVLGQILRPSWTVADARTGEHTQLDAPGYARFSPYMWADDDTVLGLGINGSGKTTPADLLACDVGGECRVVAEQIGVFRDLVLPVGYRPH